MLLAIAAATSFTIGHLATHETPTVTGTAMIGATIDSATTNQFAGGRQPTPPQPV